MNYVKNTTLFCKEKLENNGFRITPQRLNIFRCLVESDSHPSAERIYQKVKKEFPNISFDTVNRTLLCLLDKGLIKMVEGAHGPRRFDADLAQHHHFRCIYCKKIIDFQSPEYNNLDIPENIKNKFKITDQQIILKGICPECLEKKEKIKKII